MPVDEKKIRAIKKKNAQIIKKLSNLLILEYNKHGVKISRAKTMSMLMALANSNIFNTQSGAAMMVDYNYLIQQAFINGVKYQGGSKTPLTTQYSEVLSDTASSFVTKLGETLKTETLSLIQQGVADPEMNYNDIRQSVQDLLDNKQYEATRIVRTETMRASNSAAYIQAASEGKQFWTVDNRDEACEICVDEYEGQVFPIEDTASLPPLHPNCACVPDFFTEEQEAQDWANDIQSQNESARAGEEPEGGAGAWEGKQYGEGEVTVTVKEDEGGEE